MSDNPTVNFSKLPPSVGLQVNAVCDRFEAAWRSGQRARVEEFLADTPEPVYTPLLCELVLLEMEYRRLHGEDSRPEEYRSRFPSLPYGWLGDEPQRTVLTQAGRFLLREEVGRGGMGVVYRAFDPDCQRHVAVKLLHDRLQGEKDLEMRFLEAARLTSQLQHPGVPPVHEIGRLPDGRPFFAMKLVEGCTFAELLRQGREQPENMPRLLAVFTHVCQAVAFAHSHGIIHRDLKPANIMVGAFGEVQVMDWGLAKVLGPSDQTEAATPLKSPPADTKQTLPSDETRGESQDGSIVGTPAYMAPEQARGRIRNIDTRSDVFGLGGILCEILIGSPPYRAKDEFSLLVQAASGELTETFAQIEASGTDRELIQLAKTCLAADQDARPRNAGMVADAMTAYQVGVEQRLRQAELDRASAQVRVKEERRRRLTLALAASVFVLVGLFAGVGTWFGSQRAQAGREAAGLLELSADLQKHQRWDEARKALVQASSRLEGFGPADVRGRVEKAVVNLEWAARLDGIRLRRWAMSDGKTATGSAATEYAEVFADAGMDVAEGELAVIVERISDSPIRDAWVASLDDWALIIEEEGLRERLLRLARESDADRDEWRDQVRSPANWHDRKLLEKLAATAPLDSGLTPQLAIVLALRLQEKGGNAIAFLRSVQRRHPTDFWLNFLLGSLAAQMKGADGEDAAGFLRAAAIVRPSSCVVHNNLGIALEARGRLNDAVATFEDALRHDPTYARASYNLGVVLEKTGKVEESLVAYREAIRIDPAFAESHFNLGVTLAGKGAWDEAADAYAEAIRLKPELSQARQNLGLLLVQKKRQNDAVAVHQAAIKQAPSDARGHFNLGNTFADDNKFEEAIRSYREALRLDPKDFRIHNNLGVVLGKQGLAEASITALRKAVRLAPSEAGTQYNLANALTVKGRLDEAIPVYREAIRFDPVDARTRNNFAIALRKKGMLDEAIVAFRDAVRYDSQDAIGYCNLGMTLARKGALDDTITALRAASRIDPKYGKAHYNLGVALAKKGQLNDAVTAYRAAFSHESRYSSKEFNRGPALADRTLLDEEMAPGRLFRNPVEPGLGVQLSYLIVGHDVMEAYLDESSNLFRSTFTPASGKIETLSQVRYGSNTGKEPLLPINPENELLLPYSRGNTLTAGGRQQEAIASSQEIIRLDPEEARALFNFGNALSGTGRTNEAITAYRDALQIDPAFALAQNNLGVNLLREKQPADAIAAFRKAVQLDPQFAIGHNNLAVGLEQKSRLDEALIACRTALRLDSRTARIHYNLGNMLLKKGLLDEALTSYRESTRLDARDAKVHNNIGVVLARKGLLGEAEGAYREALVADATLAVAHSNLGNMLLTKGLLDDAVAAYRKALSFDRKSAIAHSNLGLALAAKGHLDSAIDEHREAAELDSESATAQYNLGLALAKNNLNSSAITAYRKAIKLDPKMALAHCNLGAALADAEQFGDTIEACRQAIKLDPKLALAYHNLGLALTRKGQTDESIAAYREAVRLDPALALSQCNLGVLLAEKRQLDSAITVLRKAIAIDPKLAIAQYNLGNALSEKGNLASAVEAYRRAIDAKEDFAEAYCNLGHALRDRGRLGEAKEAFERGQELGRQVKGWNHLTEKWAPQCGRLLAVEPKLAAILRGEKKAADVAENAILADLCRRPFQQRHAAAVRFYAEAFTADPKLADDLKAVRRYHAACAAALAGCGQGKDDPAPDEKERAQFREQALDWLWADVTLWVRQMKDGTDDAQAEAKQVLRAWKASADLACVREAANLNRLPQAERDAWRKLWSEVELLTQEKPGKQHP